MARKKSPKVLEVCGITGSQESFQPMLYAERAVNGGVRLTPRTGQQHLHCLVEFIEGVKEGVTGLLETRDQVVSELCDDYFERELRLLKEEIETLVDHFDSEHLPPLAKKAKEKIDEYLEKMEESMANFTEYINLMDSVFEAIDSVEKIPEEAANVTMDANLYLIDVGFWR